ncbi:unnamed protein product [Bemisia tabaci]|uniref:Uncharacterized protein n=1 Tax=Bemisia tabaci TaxID=7038 RepID=A0A9P0A2D0_BEMTA|nr:unnamed protein product [Bemisia tabaci]
MHKKPLKMILDDFHGHLVYDSQFNIRSGTVQGKILDQLAKSMNTTYRLYDSYATQRTGHEIGQKLGVDLHQVELGASADEADYPELDFSIGIETQAMCILTPHSKLVPQFLVPFKVFTFVVWVCIWRNSHRLPVDAVCFPQSSR